MSSVLGGKIKENWIQNSMCAQIKQYSCSEYKVSLESCDFQWQT